MFLMTDKDVIIIVLNGRRNFDRNFDRRPVPTLMITNGALNSLGDFVVSVAGRSDPPLI